MARGVRALHVCPFCGWPKRNPPAPPDDAAHGKMGNVLREHGADAFSDELFDHINAVHLQEDDRGFR